jgi:hypothetical protein
VNGLGELNKLNLPEPHSLEQGKKKTTKGRADTGLSEADKKRKEEEAAAAAAAKKAAEEQAQKKPKEKQPQRQSKLS